MKIIIVFLIFLIFKLVVIVVEKIVIEEIKKK